MVKAVVRAVVRSASRAVVRPVPQYALVFQYLVHENVWTTGDCDLSSVIIVLT